MNKDRETLIGAPKLTLYFRTDELCRVGPLDAIRMDHRQYSKIGIERAESVGIMNPLATDFLIARPITKNAERRLEAQLAKHSGRIFFQRW